MASPYSVTKRIYHSLIPARLRDRIYFLTPAPLKKVKKWGLHLLARGARHDEIYDADYYKNIIEPTMQRSSQIMAQTIAAELKPGSVVDVGCGSGNLIEALRQRGVASVKGLEYASAGVERCRQRGLDVRQFDILKDSADGLKAELVISTEVAEHLPESAADRFVDLLCGISDLIVHTAAEPSDHIGTDHINEQPRQYWIDKFTKRGRVLDDAHSNRWRTQWKDAGVAYCFYSTVMIFRK
jgi:SAM-dependent methyltransferase